MVKALKKFGQHYLQDPNILRKIAEEIAPAVQDHIIEIGPGEGQLTGQLYPAAGRLTAVEIDTRVQSSLKNRFPDLELIEADILKTDLSGIAGEKKIRIAGNIPYNITSPIIFKMIENRQLVDDAVLLIQYEVAKRITSDYGSKDYGILSVILNAYADVELCFKVSPNAFRPPPKVDSALIHIRFREKYPEISDYDVFRKTVKFSFQHRRKKVHNSISNSIFGTIDFSNCEVDLSLRAEQLQIKDFVKMSNYIYSVLKK